MMSNDPFQNPPSSDRDEQMTPTQPSGTPTPSSSQHAAPVSPTSGGVIPPPPGHEVQYQPMAQQQMAYTQQGAPTYAAYPPPVTQSYPKTWMNITALVCGILGFLTGITAIPAVIFGHMGLAAAKRGEADQRGLGVAGLILGYVMIGLTALFFIFIFVIVAIAGTSTTTS